MKNSKQTEKPDKSLKLMNLLIMATHYVGMIIMKVASRTTGASSVLIESFQSCKLDIMFDTWTGDGLWPPSGVAISFYVLILITYVIFIYELAWLQKLSAMESLQYFSARNPKLFMYIACSMSAYVLILAPIRYLATINSIENGWNFPIFAELGFNAVFVAIILSVLAFLWTIFYDFKFHQKTFELKVESLMQYTNFDETNSSTLASFSIPSSVREVEYVSKPPFWIEKSQIFGSAKNMLLVFALPALLLYLV